jgi:DNA-binding LacI/PurR family transcriptional regulator
MIWGQWEVSIPAHRGTPLSFTRQGIPDRFDGPPVLDPANTEVWLDKIALFRYYFKEQTIVHGLQLRLIIRNTSVVKQTTVKDIASLAGVSVSTVSRALNGKGRMEETTRQRIVDLAQELDYHPSAFAQGLVLQRTMTLMLIIPDTANYFFAEVIGEIGDVCRETGYKVLLGHTGNRPEVELEYLTMIRQGMVDGAIVAPLSNTPNLSSFLELVQLKFPMVFFDRTLPRLEMNHVLVDNMLGARQAVEYLHAKGHRRIAYMGGPMDHKPFKWRYEGYIQAHEALGLSVNEAYISQSCISPDEGCVESITAFFALDEAPTAILTDSDQKAIGCIADLQSRGMKVPNDVAVIGFDNINIGAHVAVPLTTVAQPKQAISRAAVDRVLELIDQRKNNQELTISEQLLAPELVIRKSA